MICPEESLTRYIGKLIEYPEALQVREFAGGLACLVSVRAVAGAPLLEMLGGGGSSLESSRADVGSMSPAKLEAIAPVDANLTCAPHAFKNVHVLSREPLVVYIEGFLGPEETNEVVALR